MSAVKQFGYAVKFNDQIVTVCNYKVLNRLTWNSTRSLPLVAFENVPEIITILQAIAPSRMEVFCISLVFPFNFPDSRPRRMKSLKNRRMVQMTRFHPRTCFMGVLLVNFSLRVHSKLTLNGSGLDKEPIIYANCFISCVSHAQLMP